MRNYARMMQLAEEVFAMHEDPTKLQVDPEVLEHLLRLHPASVSERADADGPIAWVLADPYHGNVDGGLRSGRTHRAGALRSHSVG